MSQVCYRCGCSKEQLQSNLVPICLDIMADSSVQDWKLKYVTSVKDGFQRIMENNLSSGKIVGLERQYPRLRAIQVKSEDHSLPYSGSLIEQAEVNTSSDKYSPSTIQALYVPDVHGFVTKTVVVQGPAGIGKTVTSQKMMLDWASGKLYGDKFNFVFYMSCREINRITGNINLAGLLAKTCNMQCSDDLVKAIFQDPAKVLLIIDGFDELRWSLEDNYEEYQDPFQETHKEILLRSIFRKEVLNATSLMITTRAFSLEKLKDYVQPPCSVEILGFTGRDLEDYISNFFKNKEVADKALAGIKGNEALLTMCSVPLMCWIVCTILKQGVKHDTLAHCKTATSIYLLYLKNSIKYDVGKQLINTCIKKLCSLANDGILNQKLWFEEGDLARYGLALSEVESVFLNQNIFHWDTETSIYYSFSHLSVQEFFAALYYVLVEETKNKEGHPEVCKGNSLSEQSAHHPHLTQTVRFLCGLLNEQQLKEFTSGVGCDANLRAKPALEKWISGGKPSRFCNDALHCIYEMQDEAFRDRVLHQEDLLFSPCLYFGVMENICTRELFYCLADAKGYCSISLEDYLLRPGDLEILSPLFHRASKLSFTRCGFPEDAEKGGYVSWLCNPNSKIQELELQVCVVTPPFFKDLHSFISTNRTITKLIIGHHKLADCALKLVCDGLRHPGCTVQELTLDDCDLTSSSCEELGSAIKTNRSLRKLDMALNKLQDDGVKFLCEGLKDPGCTLQELRMSYSELTPACCEYLGSVLLVNRSLTTLFMSDNDLQDSGAKLVCEGLRHPDSALKELRIHESNLTSACCEDFRSVLLANRSLTTLDLTYNNLQDTGIKVLCEGLRDPGCTLKELVLSHCDLTSSSCDDIRSVITTNRSLVKLDLTWNSLQDSVVKPLCEALKDPACILRELSLYGCDLTSSSCADLCSLITTTQSLTSLDLAGNQFQDPGVKLLCEALRKTSCHLQVVRVGYGDLTNISCDEILAAVNANKCLTELDITMNVDEEQPCADVDALCKRLERPACTVEKSVTQDGTFVYFKYKKQN
ncbi:NACHT, LRR and PYD domains-containing protein 3-like isoform X1 [Mixophyes fleayi]|uniref:NACHT, LRR and PYD domains-containing protein 3-like isoform X1 n=2 Tax=Mixophyes fleayi TaxID=3061075 RepID=UPI003F4DACB7